MKACTVDKGHMMCATVTVQLIALDMRMYYGDMVRRNSYAIGS